MEKLGPNEKELLGASIRIDKQIIRDPVSLRIAYLVANELIEVGTADEGWSTLYRDPADGRYWEHSYPQSEMHGGGPPALIQLEAEIVERKYGVR
jgi:hypothetical protein